MPVTASTGASRRLPAPRIAPEGKWGPWLEARRTENHLTQQQVFDALRKRWPDLFPWRAKSSIDSYRAYEKGRSRPTPTQEAAFLEFYPNADPPADEASPAERDGPGDALLRALKDQTTALTELAAQVKRLVDREPTQTAAMTADLVAVAIRGTLQDVGLVDRTPRS